MQSYTGDQIKKTGMGRVCSTQGESAYRVSVGKPERSRPLGVYGRTILKSILLKWDGDTDWIDLAQDRDRWRALVKAVLNLLNN
jgi:hypothetical protein